MASVHIGEVLSPVGNVHQSIFDCWLVVTDRNWEGSRFGALTSALSRCGQVDWVLSLHAHAW